jgi:hypothetical protein
VWERKLNNVEKSGCAVTEEDRYKDKKYWREKTALKS